MKGEAWFSATVSGSACSALIPTFWASGSTWKSVFGLWLVLCLLISQRYTETTSTSGCRFIGEVRTGKTVVLASSGGLREGTDIQTAQAEMDVISRSLAEQYPA